MELFGLKEELGGRPFTTTLLARRLQTSQQTASRRLIDLEGRGLIRRVKAPRGETVQVTEKGLEALREVYLTLKNRFEPAGKLSLEGVVATGVGEGAYYMGQEGYKAQFKRRFGFIPYPGTLNILLDDHSRGLRKTLRLFKPVVLEGFHKGERSFGQVHCYPAVLDGVEDVTVVTALRSHYGDEVLEVVSPLNLRRRLGLKDGDRVTVTVHSTLE